MTTTRQHRPRARSFTLIEVLLAVVVFSIVLAAIHMVFYGAIRLRNKTTLALENAAPLRHTLAIIKRDLANVVVPGGTLSGQLQTTTTTTAGSRLGASQSASQSTSQSRLGSLSASGSASQNQTSPEFYTAVGIIDDTAPWAEVEKVSYHLADPTNNTAGKDLFRTVTRNLLPTLQEEPLDQWLMSGVRDIAFYFYDGNQWRDYWDSTTETNALPAAIKVALQLAAEDPARATDAETVIELVVPLVVQARTNQTTQTTQTTGGQP
jgi:type II secretion system protein J